MNDFPNLDQNSPDFAIKAACYQHGNAVLETVIDWIPHEVAQELTEESQ